MTAFGVHSTTDEVLGGAELAGVRVFLTGVSSGDRGISVAAVHPGRIRTGLLLHTTPELMQQMVAGSTLRADGTRGDPSPLKTVEEGAAATAWAAFVAPADEVAGRYCEDCHVAEVAESGSEGVRPYAVDPERAAALRAASEALVEESFA